MVHLRRCQGRSASAATAATADARQPQEEDAGKVDARRLDYPILHVQERPTRALIHTVLTIMNFHAVMSVLGKKKYE